MICVTASRVHVCVSTGVSADASVRSDNTWRRSPSRRPLRSVTDWFIVEPPLTESALMESESCVQPAREMRDVKTSLTVSLFSNRVRPETVACTGRGPGEWLRRAS
jgi:hypothetical protein